MKAITTLLLIVLPMAAASAQHLTATERARLETDVAVQRSIAQDQASSVRAYDTAIGAMRGIDRTVGAVARTVPGGSAAYALGGAIGRQGYDVYQRRGRR